MSEQTITREEQLKNLKDAAQAEKENIVLLYEPSAEEISTMNLLKTLHLRDEYVAKGFRQQMRSAIGGTITKNLRERELARRKGNKQDAAQYDEVLDVLYAQSDRL